MDVGMIVQLNFTCHHTLSVTTNIKNVSTIITTTQTVTDGTLCPFDQFHIANSSPWMENTHNYQPSKLLHMAAVTDTSALHSPDSCSLADLVTIQHEIQSNIQELAQLFPAITNHFYTDPHLKVNKALQTIHGTCRPQCNTLGLVLLLPWPDQLLLHLSCTYPCPVTVTHPK